MPTADKAATTADSGVARQRAIANRASTINQRQHKHHSKAQHDRATAGRPGNRATTPISSTLLFSAGCPTD